MGLQDFRKVNVCAHHKVDQSEKSLVWNQQPK